MNKRIALILFIVIIAILTLLVSAIFIVYSRPFAMLSEAISFANRNDISNVEDCDWISAENFKKLNVSGAVPQEDEYVYIKSDKKIAEISLDEMIVDYTVKTEIKNTQTDEETKISEGKLKVYFKLKNLKWEITQIDKY